MSAEPAAPLDLFWQAPPGCPDQPAVLSKIRTFVGHGFAHDHQLRAEGRIVPHADGFRLTLVIRAGALTGERAIESASCRDLAAAAAVALALLLQSPEPLQERDLSGNERGTIPPAAPSPSPVAPPPERFEPRDAARDALAPGRESPERESLVDVLVHVPRFVVDVGPLPRPSAGVGLAVGIRYRVWQLLAGVHTWAPQTIAAAEFRGYGAEVSRRSAEVWGCRGFALSRVEIAPCLQMSSHWLTATGTGRDVTPTARSVTWLSAGAAGQARYLALDWLALVVSAGARLELSRPRILIANVGTVSQLAPASFTVRVGTEWIW